MKKLYGIGVGPGDKELITLKAYRLIEKADYIFIPESKGDSFAGRIVEEYTQGKKVVKLDFPMGENNGERYKIAAEKVVGFLKNEEVGVFLTLGDPMTYSTFIYLMKELEAFEIETEVVPGITSYTSAFAALKLPATLKGDSLYLCDGEIDPSVLAKIDTICVLKVNKHKKEILDLLEMHSFKYAYVKRCTCEDEKILLDREDILKDEDYMSLIVARRKKHD